MYCPNCGRQIAPARFCIYCGKRLPTDSARAAKARPAPEKAAPHTPRRTGAARAAVPLLSAAAVSAAACAAFLAFSGLRRTRPDVSAVLRVLRRPGGQG